MASETKWTPGPWAVCREERGFMGESGRPAFAVVQPTKENRPDARICEFETGHVDAETEANAALVAAAPLLYDVLREALVDYGARMSADCLNRARAALAKARGE